MRISHETPISLFERSLDWNDYQYCLVHLLSQEPEYLKHFERCRDEKIPFLLDNSIFELGEAFEADEFAKWVRRLRPDEYIIPDVLEDAANTIANMYSWFDKYSDLPGKTIGVVQGKTYEEIVKCYKAIDSVCDKIAISFDYSYYEESFPHENKFVSWCYGRVVLIQRLLRDGIINKDKPHHLLGVSLPQEFIHYQDYTWIDSMDSSNPIVHGLLDIRYEEYGLLDKQSIKLCDMITRPVENLESIKMNVAKFRKMVTGTYINPNLRYKDEEE